MKSKPTPRRSRHEESPSSHRSSAPSLAAIAVFKAQVMQWAGRIRVHPRQLRLQRMRRKWASCSTCGTVSFSTEVLAQPAPFREYVIVHELLHLKVPNHGKLFKTLLRACLPNPAAFPQASRQAADG